MFRAVNRGVVKGASLHHKRLVLAPSENKLGHPTENSLSIACCNISIQLWNCILKPNPKFSTSAGSSQMLIEVFASMVSFYQCLEIGWKVIFETGLTILCSFSYNRPHRHSLCLPSSLMLVVLLDELWMDSLCSRIISQDICHELYLPGKLFPELQYLLGRSC